MSLSLESLTVFPGRVDKNIIVEVKVGSKEKKY